MNFMKNLMSNPYTSLAGYIFGLGGLIGDTLNLNSPYLYSLIVGSIPLGVGFFQEYKKIKLYKKTFLPIPIVINISNYADSKNALNQLANKIEEEGYKEHLENLKKFFSIEPEDLIFEYKGNIFDKSMLIDFLKILKHDLEKLERKIPQGDIFYVAYIGPVSVSILVGGVLAQDAIKIFQYNKSVEGYEEVITVKDRRIKENINFLEKFDLEEIKKDNQENAVLAIDMSSHKININDESLRNYGDLYYLKSKGERGTISYNDNWERYIQEIFYLINKLQTEYKSIKLVYSMPVSIGLGIGMAIQNYWPILLTNYQQGEGYKDLIYTNEIKYYL